MALPGSFRPCGWTTSNGTSPNQGRIHSHINQEVPAQARITCRHAPEAQRASVAASRLENMVPGFYRKTKRAAGGCESLGRRGLVGCTVAVAAAAGQRSRRFFRGLGRGVGRWLGG